MGSYAQAISYQNRETASAIRVETETGSHMFKISGYSLLKGIGSGNCYKSGTSTIGGYNWIIEYYPDGHSSRGEDRICFFLRPESAATVKVRVTFTILTQNGYPSSNIFYASELKIFKPCGYSYYENNHIYSVERSKVEASSCLKDDAFTVKCTITVVKRTHVEVINGATVPPLN